MNYQKTTMAKQMAGRILGSYRDTPANPEIFAAELVAILADYPEDVQRRAVHRLQTTLQRLPSLKQCKDALDDARAITAPKKKTGRQVTDWDLAHKRAAQLTAIASTKYRDQLKHDTQLQWWIGAFAEVVSQYEAMGIKKAEEAAAWHFGISDVPDPWIAGNYRVRHKANEANVPATASDARLDFTE